MTNQDAIKYLQQLYPNGGHCWLDEQRIEAIRMAVKALQEEPVNKDLEEASKEYATNLIGYDEENNQAITELNDIEYYAFKAGAQWQLSKLPKWEKAINRSCWSGEIGVNPTKRKFEYEHYVIDADKLFEALEKEE